MRISILATVMLAASSAAAQAPATSAPTAGAPTASAPAGGAAAGAPVAKWDTGGGGFIDDAYALRDDGKAIAYLTTDGATMATLHFAEVGGKASDVAGAPADAVALAWLSPTRVLVVRGRDGSSTAQAFSAAGPDKGKPLGPFGRFAFATVDGKRAFVTYTRGEKHGVEHTLVSYSVDTLKPLKRHTWREDAEGQIKEGPSSVKPLWWAEGYTVLAALRAGEFDKARDMRRPDRYARLDALGGKVLVESEVKDLLAFTQVSLVRRDAPNEPVIARYSDDRKRLLLIDGIEEGEVKLPRPLWRYDVASLQWQTLDDRRVALSLTVDPVNPDAVAKKKADPDDIELYEVDRASRAATLRLRLPGQGRPSSWRIAAHRVLLLRKDKGFDRGGVALELYDLP